MLRAPKLPVSARCTFRVSLAISLVLILASSCTIDERPLRLTVSPALLDSAGGSRGVGGANNAGGAAGVAGADSVQGEPGSAGAAGDHELVGSLAGLGGEPSSAGAAGAGAPAFIGPCGDIDGNALDDCSETLLQNSSFDSNLDQWKASAPFSQFWDARNALPTGLSGSLSLSNSDPVADLPGLVLVAAEQCVPVTGDLNYLLAARVLIPSGQGQGQAAINLWVFANDDCQGTFLDAFTPVTTEVTGDWTTASAELQLPSAARSMVVRLGAVRPFPQAHFQVLFDDVLVKPK
jgi:hypothetical protein